MAADLSSPRMNLAFVIASQGRPGPESPARPPSVRKVSKRLASETPQRTGSWFGSGIVILGAAFLLLTLNEGKAGGYQTFVDFVFHSWPLMAAATTIVWIARRGQFGTLPRTVRAIATILLPFFVLFTFFALLSSPLLWEILQPLGLARSHSVPVAAFAAVVLFVIGGAWLFIRGFFRWIGRRYQRHGFAVGFGPIYFYFRKRRSQ